MSAVPIAHAPNPAEHGPVPVPPVGIPISAPNETVPNAPDAASGDANSDTEVASFARGTFHVYAWQPHLSIAAFLQDPQQKTPVMARFCSRAVKAGVTAPARAASGFAVRFFTSAGDFDLLSSNLAAQLRSRAASPAAGTSAAIVPGDTAPAVSTDPDFWSFVARTPASVHAMLWLMSDRSLPRSYRMMEGFGTDSFRLVAADGSERFVRFHWKPLLGLHAISEEEARHIATRDPDFLRRDLREAIEVGAFPEWELGVQVIENKDESLFLGQLLDPYRLIPEELVPVQRIGRMVLDRNVDAPRFDADWPAFHATHLVPGITLNDNDTDPAATASQKTAAALVAAEDESGQARRYFRSLADWEQSHIIKALRHALDGNNDPALVAQILELLRCVDPQLCWQVMRGITLPAGGEALLHLGTSNAIRKDDATLDISRPEAVLSPALSMANRPARGIRTRRIVMLAADGVDAASLRCIEQALVAAGAIVTLVSLDHRCLVGIQGEHLRVAQTLDSTSAVSFDAIYIPGGGESVAALIEAPEVKTLLTDAYLQCKTIAATDDGTRVLSAAGINVSRSDAQEEDPGLVFGARDEIEDIALDFIDAIAQHRHWHRSRAD